MLVFTGFVAVLLLLNCQKQDYKNSKVKSQQKMYEKLYNNIFNQ